MQQCQDTDSTYLVKSETSINIDVFLQIFL